MEGLKIETFKTVVMDASDDEVLMRILKYIYLFEGGLIKRIKFYPMSDELPTMQVIEIDTDAKTYDGIQWVLDNWYPGLCVFNLPDVID
jgi:hypothetical protein